jgi:hypothetical protein
LLVAALVVSVVGIQTAGAVTHRYVEDFASKEHCDTLNTTASWDTSLALLRLPAFDPRLTGSITMQDTAYGVTICGDYAYVGAYSGGLQIVDISDPDNPSVAGIYDTPDYANNIAISGDYAFVGDWASGLQVVDISDPTNPTFAGSFNPPGMALGVDISGDHAFVAHHAPGGALQIFDISDPTNPVPVASYDTPGPTRIVKVSGDYAYVAEIDSGLEVVDVSDPTNPTFAGRCVTPGVARGVDVFGDYAFIGDDLQGLQVIDISDPTDPVIVGNFPMPSNARRVRACGDYVYVADHEGGLQVVDVSDPANPISAGVYDTFNHAHGVDVSGTVACVADWEGGLQVVHAADVVLPPLRAGSLGLAGSAEDAAVAGDYAFVAAGASGLQTIDVTDPMAPTLGGSFTTPGNANSIVTSGNYAYVADGASGLQVIDITDPESPAPAGTLDTSGNAEDIAIAGNYAYVADGAAGLQVVDITDPVNPSASGSYVTPDQAKAVLLAGDFAYVANLASGLEVVDITGPTSPTFEGRCDTPGSAQGIAVSGDYVYVADGDSGLRVIDITDPASPFPAGGCDTPGSAADVSIAGDYAFVSDGTSGLLVIDVSEPTAPAIVGSYDTHGAARGLAVEGDYAFVADGDSGFTVIKVFERRFDISGDIAQSAVIHESGELFEQVRLTTNQTDSISWDISADGGTHWEPLLPDGAWHTLAYPGSTLLWRANLAHPAGAVNPTCAGINLQYQNDVTTHVMDGILDPNSMLLASSGGLNLYADWDGEYLYLATEGVGGTSGWDHFILVGTDLYGTAAAPWAKSGTVAAKALYLGNEDSSNWCGWHDDADTALTWGVACTSGTYLEGIIRLETYLAADLRHFVHLAAAAYESPDGGALVTQAPAGDANGDIETDEYAYFPLRALDGALDARAVPAASGDGFNLYADWDGEYLYVAAEGVQATVGLDHFILLGLDLLSPVAAPWAKSGNVADRILFLANEDANNFCAWYDSTETPLSGVGVRCTSGEYLEGVVRLETHLGSLPPDGIHLAASGYASPDSGTLQAQAPAGDGDGDIDAGEYAYHSWGTSGVEEPEPGEDLIPDAVIFKVGPNPFAGRTRIMLGLGRTQDISIEIYDLRGRKIRTLAQGRHNPGTYSLEWTGTNHQGRKVSAGIYFIRLRTETATRSAKAILLH